MGTNLNERLSVTMYLDDPADATVARDIGWVDMSGYDRILVGVMLNSGTGLLAFKILGNSDSAGGGTDVELAVHADCTVADAAGDTVWLEVSADEIAALAVAAGHVVRYVSANLDCDAAADIASVVYIRADASYGGGPATEDVIAP